MQISGKIIQSLPLQSGTSKAGNAWKKQEHILEIPGQYARKVFFHLFGDHVDKFPLQVGLDVTLDVDIESREYRGRWYTDVRAWNVTYTQSVQPAQQSTAYAAPAPQPQPTPANDLPF